MSETYTYALSEFVGSTHEDVVDPARLRDEIEAAAITIALDETPTVVGSNCDVTFKAAISSGEETTLDGIVAAHTGQPVTPDPMPVEFPNRQINDVPFVALADRLGKDTIYSTHNYCDATSWYSESTRVTEQALTDTGDGLSWSCPDTNIIDMFHGKVFDEDPLRDEQDHGYKVLVESSSDGQNWTIEKQRPPLATSGGDYSLNYATGVFTFFSSRSGKQVRASYSKEAGSGWLVVPTSGRKLSIEMAEIQFSENIDFDSYLVMTMTGHCIYFYPEGAESNGGPLADDYPIEISRTVYKNMAQMLDESVGTFATLANIGVTGAIGSPVTVLQFRYGRPRQVYSSLGMKIRIGLGRYSVDENGDFNLEEWTTPMGGTRATGTFYMPSQTDPGAAQALVELSAL